MAIQSRQPAEYKNYLVELLIGFEAIAAKVQASNADLARMTDTQVGTVIGVADSDANALKGAFASANTAIAAWNKTNQDAALGIRVR